MRIASAVAVGAAASLLALALVIEAPATLVDGRVEALSSGRVRVANATGTIWNGSGEISLPAAGVRIPVAWSIDAVPVLWGELRGTISQSGGPPAAFDLGRDRYVLRNLALALPAESVLRATDSPPSMAGAGGAIEM